MGPKKTPGKANARGLTGAEIAARELNTREREQRVQEKEQLALDLTSSSPKNVAVATGRGDGLLCVRATPSQQEEEEAEEAEEVLQKAVDAQEAVEVQEGPFVLPASTAPALLQTNSRPKRARGPTLDYKAMHEGRQMQPKRSRDAQK